MRHLIKKQIFELSLDEGLNYFHVQQLVSDRYWNEIVPILEKSFDAIVKEEEVVEIDHLELDLGTLSEKDLRSREWINKVRRQIEEKIAAITNRESSRYQVRSRDRRLGVFDQWLYYMEHGYLSWNSDKPGEKWYRDVLDNLLINQDSLSILKNKLQDQTILRRLVYLHDDDFLNNLADIISGKKQENLKIYIRELRDLNRHLLKKEKFTGHDSDSDLRNKLWNNIFRQIQRESDPESLRDHLIRTFILEKRFTSKIQESAVKIPLTLPHVNKFLAELKTRQKKEKKAVEKAIKDIGSSLKNPGDTAENEKPASTKGNVPDEEGIFIVNAGGVLLHPFLKTFFTRLELVKENRFTDEKARVKGIYLIHYLCTGRTDAEEFELTIAKLLCNLPLESPVEPVIPDPAFIIEADKLIEAALDQWSILKNTSAAGLREGFLQRPGKLFSKNSDIHLRVERNPIDVLLDYLPWNLSIIMLPWMKDVIRVDWR